MKAVCALLILCVAGCSDAPTLPEAAPTSNDLEAPPSIARIDGTYNLTATRYIPVQNAQGPVYGVVLGAKNCALIVTQDETSQVKASGNITLQWNDPAETLAVYIRANGGEYLEVPGTSPLPVPFSVNVTYDNPLWLIARLSTVGPTLMAPSQMKVELEYTGGGLDVMAPRGCNF